MPKITLRITKDKELTEEEINELLSTIYFDPHVESIDKEGEHWIYTITRYTD